MGSYFGMRTFTLGKDADQQTRPLLNGKFVFAAGWLDQVQKRARGGVRATRWEAVVLPCGGR